MGRVLNFYEFGDDDSIILAETVEQAYEFYVEWYEDDSLFISDFLHLEDDVVIGVGMMHTPNGIELTDASIRDILDNLGDIEVPRLVHREDIRVTYDGSIQVC